MEEKEFVWKHLHYALDDLEKFSIIRVYPELPYQYTQKELELYKNNVQYDCKQLCGSDKLGYKEACFNITFHTREELFEVHNYLLHSGYSRIKLLYLSELTDDEDCNYVPLKSYTSRVWFDIEKVKKQQEGSPSLTEWMENDNVHYWPEFSDNWNKSTAEPLRSYNCIQIKVNTKEIEKFIDTIKSLRNLGYKNMWLYPGRQLSTYQDLDNRLLIK